MTTEAYPLAWPEGRPRTPQWNRETACFKTSFARARDDVIHNAAHEPTATNKQGD